MNVKNSRVIVTHDHDIIDQTWHIKWAYVTMEGVEDKQLCEGQLNSPR